MSETKTKETEVERVKKECEKLKGLPLFLQAKNMGDHLLVTLEGDGTTKLLVEDRDKSGRLVGKTFKNYKPSIQFEFYPKVKGGKK